MPEESSNPIAKFLSWLAPYRKTGAALVVGLLGWGTAVVASDPIPVTGSEWIQLGTVAATAAGVFAITNKG